MGGVLNVKVGMNDKTCFSMTLLVHFLPILLIFHFVLPLIICTISLSPYLISFFCIVSTK